MTSPAGATSRSAMEPDGSESIARGAGWSFIEANSGRGERPRGYQVRVETVKIRSAAETAPDCQAVALASREADCRPHRPLDVLVDADHVPPPRADELVHRAKDAVVRVAGIGPPIVAEHEPARPDLVREQR